MGEREQEKWSKKKQGGERRRGKDEYISNVSEIIDTSDTPMNAKNIFVDNGCEREPIKHRIDCFPNTTITNEIYIYIYIYIYICICVCVCKEINQ